VLELLETPGGYGDRSQPPLRRCSRCGEIKPVEEFPMKNKARGLRRVWCRDCCRAYGREHYRRNKPAYMKRARKRAKWDRLRVREAVANYLRAHPCVDCGEADILLLDFDHRDRSLKRAPVARLVSTGALSLVMAEIAKCDVRCGNCHRKRTAAQFNWRKSPKFQNSRQAPIAPPRRAPRPSATGRPVTEQLSIWNVGIRRRCSRCLLEKPLHDFAFSDRTTGTRQSLCRACHAAARHENYLLNRATYIAWATRQMRRKRDEHVALVHAYLRDHPCVDCGERDITLLEFDHADPSTKTRDVATMLGHMSWPKVRDEIAKCDVRCVNCHRRRTAERGNWRKLLGEDAVSYNADSRGCVVVVTRDFPKVQSGVRFASPAQ